MRIGYVISMNSDPQELKEARAEYYARWEAVETVKAEDLAVHKVFAGRDLDWGDVERVLIRQHGKLDLEQIRAELKPLLDLKGELQALEKLDRMLATVERRLRAKL